MVCIFTKIKIQIPGLMTTGSDLTRLVRFWLLWFLARSSREFAVQLGLRPTSLALVVGRQRDRGGLSDSLLEGASQTPMCICTPSILLRYCFRVIVSGSRVSLRSYITCKLLVLMRLLVFGPHFEDQAPQGSFICRGQRRNPRKGEQTFKATDAALHFC